MSTEAGLTGPFPSPDGNKAQPFPQKVLWLSNHLRDCGCLWHMKASPGAIGEVQKQKNREYGEIK